MILGIIAGLILNRYSTNGISMAVLNITVTIKYILGQLDYLLRTADRAGIYRSVHHQAWQKCFADAGSCGCPRLRLLCWRSAFFHRPLAFYIIPHLSIHSYAAGLKRLPEVIFELEIPQIMSVMSALVFAMMLGLAATWTRAKLITGLLDEFQKIVLSLVARIIIPIPSAVHRHYLLRPCLRGNHYQTAACLPEGHRTGA